VNLTGTFHAVQAAIPDMLDASWGRIVTISSSSAQSGAARMAHYVASKGGVIGLTKALAVEYAPNGITVNTIPPGFIDTPMVRRAEARGDLPPVEAVIARTPVRRAGTPEDIAAACAFLCSDDAGYVTGQVIGVNGGWYLRATVRASRRCRAPNGATTSVTRCAPGSRTGSRLASWTATARTRCRCRTCSAP
jgi:NAD(P)-dependent dehydrogenase (short-subunit alcohol dehydrogenase family)